MKVTEFRLKLYPQDFELVREFYSSVLGFEIVDEFESGVMFGAGPAIIELLRPERPFAQVQGSDISLEVDDVTTLWNELKDTCAVRFEFRHNAWGDTSFCVADPEGFEITFFTKD